jgi:Na+/proline symporter
MVAAAVLALLLAPLVLVLDRIGVPVRLLLGVTAAVGMGGFCLAALSGGTMRLPVYLTAGRGLSGATAGLGFAIATPLTAVWADTLATAAGLLAFSLILAPAIRASGAVSLPTFLAARYGGRALRLLAAVLVVGAAPVLAAASLAKAADAVSLALPLAPATALSLCVIAIVAPLAAAGTSGLVRGAIVAALVALLASFFVLTVGYWTGTGPMSSVGPVDARNLGSPHAVAILATVFALPSLASLSAALREPSQGWRAAVWAALACLALGLGIAAIPAGEPAQPLAFAAMAGAALRVVAPLAVSLALVCAAGVALGYDLPGRRDRLRVSTSRRFAQLRLAMIVMASTAGWIAARFAPSLAQWNDFAEAALVAGVLPTVLLTLIRRSAGPGAAGTAMLLGLGSAALAYDPRVWGPAGPPASFAIVGLVVGLAAGLAVSFIAPASRPLPAEDDAAL